MGRLFTILLLFVSSFGYGQNCLGSQTVTMTPTGPYSPGDVVIVEYTLWGFIQVNYNWLVWLDIDLGPGWVNLILLQPPSTQYYTGNWQPQYGNTTYPNGLTLGPGYVFVSTGTPGWGDGQFGTTGYVSGPWTMRFQITVGPTCTPDNLNVDVKAVGDCQTGVWVSPSCCTIQPYNIYNGTVQIVPFLSPPINHY